MNIVLSYQRGLEVVVAHMARAALVHHICLALLLWFIKFYML